MNEHLEREPTIYIHITILTWRWDLKVLDLGDVGAAWSRVKGRHQSREGLFEDVVLLPTSSPCSHLFILEEWGRERVERGKERERGREKGKERGREGEREGGREGGREGKRQRQGEECVCMYV